MEKGHLVRERLDANGRRDGRVADKSGIQFRLLNRRQGPSRTGTARPSRSRHISSRNMLSETEQQANLRFILRAEVTDFILQTGA